MGKQLSLSYGDLEQMEKVKKKVILICSNDFVDYAEWEGVPLNDILKLARVKKKFKLVRIYGAYNYTSYLHKESEVDKHFIFLALRVNGEVLPKDHGFPVRVVVEDMYGSSWVKWVREINVE